MTHALEVRLSSVLLALGALAFVLAACGGKGAFAPATSTQSADRTQNFASAGCPPPYGTYGGTYVFLHDAGNVRNGTFTPILSRSVWERSVYVMGSSPPPTIPPHPPIYVYRGTYKDVHGVTIGCAVLITSQNGQPIPAFHNANASDSESPAFMHGTRISRLLGLGAVRTLTITKLSATGGHGSYTLSDGSTGTITFTLRQAVP